jgi:hypothetical protein
MANNKSERNPETVAESHPKGLSNEAWAAIISGIFAILTAILTAFLPLLHPDHAAIEPSPNPGRSTSPESTTPQTPQPRSSTSPHSSSSPQAQALLTALQAANITYSVSDAQILDWLGSPGAEYPQIAAGCLALLPQQRLKSKVPLDVIVYDYKQVSGLPVAQPLPLNHDVDLEKLNQAIVMAYNGRQTPSVQALAEIVESL